MKSLKDICVYINEFIEVCSWIDNINNTAICEDLFYHKYMSFHIKKKNKFSYRSRKNLGLLGVSVRPRLIKCISTNNKRRLNFFKGKKKNSRFKHHILDDYGDEMFIKRRREEKT